MPDWVQWLVAAAAVVGALGVLITKAIRPGIRAASAAEEALPLLREATIVFRDTPDIFRILKDMASQFRTDSGSSMRDVVNRLEAAALENARATEALRIGTEANRMLSERDREMLNRLHTLVDRLTIRMDALSVIGHRIEAEQGKAAQALISRDERLDRDRAGVADDLAASRQRADVAEGEAGTAADAASQSGVRPEGQP